MRINRGSFLALQMLEHLAVNDGNATATVRAVAEDRHLPQNYLGKMLRGLVAAEVLSSSRGPGGGFRLARPMDQISLLEVIEVIEGPIRGEVTRAAGAQPTATGFDDRLEAICKRLAEQTRQELATISLADLVTGR